MQNLRKLLLPFSWLYGIGVYIRNSLYNFNFFKTVSYKFPVICIGNLNVGGTGKTPMTEYVASYLSTTYKTAILSRGYKRNSKGFLFAEEGITTELLGDEPYQYFRKFKNVLVAVDEDRRRGIEILRENYNAAIIVLDDALQHRRVTAGLNILLTVYQSLYVDDLLLPAGNLRDSKTQAQRADIIIVTKCPDTLRQEKKKEIAKRLLLLPHQKIFFSTIIYSEIVSSSNNTLPINFFKDKIITVVTGIANPTPLLNHLKKQEIKFKHLKFSDHHRFSEKELTSLKQYQYIITTEKDYVKLKALKNVYYIPIRLSFFQDGGVFNKVLSSFVQSFP